MPSMTVKGIPDELFARLRYRADQHRRSMNSEIIVLLEEALGMRARAQTAVLKEIEEAQRHMPFVKHEAVNDYRKRGRA